MIRQYIFKDKLYIKSLSKIKKKYLGKIKSLFKRMDSSCWEVRKLLEDNNILAEVSRKKKNSLLLLFFIQDKLNSSANSFSKQITIKLCLHLSINFKFQGKEAPLNSCQKKTELSLGSRSAVIWKEQQHFVFHFFPTRLFKIMHKLMSAFFCLPERLLSHFLNKQIW